MVLLELESDVHTTGESVPIVSSPNCLFVCDVTFFRIWSQDLEDDTSVPTVIRTASTLKVP